MSELIRPFRDLTRARFVERPNRFLVRCRVDGRRMATLAYLPNPGRLRELLLPDVALYLVKNTSETSKTAYTVVAVDREGARGLSRPIMLHTHKTNDVARRLLEAGLVPGFETARVVKAEHTVGRSRFDFLLERDGAPVLLEVKSCTLVGRHAAMFPDAVTARGARHVRELAELARSGAAPAVLFVVQWPEVRVFSPDYHTDLEFTRALLESREALEVVALAVGWTEELALDSSLRPCAIPWDVIVGEAEDRGSYLIVLEVAQPLELVTGALGKVAYRKGFYVYVGSAMANLTTRIDRHRRLRKRLHWHIDFLRDEATFIEALPIRSSRREECDVARAIGEVTEGVVAGFGASDCRCDSHLFWTPADPRRSLKFQRTLLELRMKRLEST